MLRISFEDMGSQRMNKRVGGLPPIETRIAWPVEEPAPDEDRNDLERGDKAPGDRVSHDPPPAPDGEGPDPWDEPVNNPDGNLDDMEGDEDAKR